MARVAAAKGELAALKMSARKWYNYGFCTQRQFENEGMDNREDFQSCAMCRLYDNACHRWVNPCVLERKDICCHRSKDIWSHQNDKSMLYWQWKNLHDSFRRRPSKTKFDRMQQKARRIWREICKCIEELENKQRGK